MSELAGLGEALDIALDGLAGADEQVAELQALLAHVRDVHVGDIALMTLRITL